MKESEQQCLKIGWSNSSVTGPFNTVLLVEGPTQKTSKI